VSPLSRLGGQMPKAKCSRAQDLPSQWGWTRWWAIWQKRNDYCVIFMIAACFQTVPQLSLHLLNLKQMAVFYDLPFCCAALGRFHPCHGLSDCLGLVSLTTPYTHHFTISPVCTDLLLMSPRNANYMRKEVANSLRT
jgi:hypothetical protein